MRFGLIQYWQQWRWQFQNQVKGDGFAESDNKAMIESDGFDYTKWRCEFFCKMKPDEFSEQAVAYAKAHPHEGKGKRL